MASKCRSCGAPIIWAVNQGSGKREPLDAEPVTNGNIEIVGEVEDQFGTSPKVRHLPASDSLPGFETGDRYVSHFATCPDAAKHRKADE